MTQRTRRKPYRNRRWSPKSDRVLLLLIMGAVVVVGLLIYEAVRPMPGLAQPDLGNEHITPPATATYNTRPPTSGPHYVNLAPWGIHTEPIQNELQVHNLEDGGVMVQYDCPEGCPDLVAQLAEVVGRYPQYVILAPYPDMDTRIALTAWGRLDAFEDFDERRVVKFIEAYRGIDHHR